MKRVFQQARAGKDGWTTWTQPDPRGHYIACCDCGLTHKFQFAVAESRDGRKKRAQYRARLAPRYTARNRRRK